MSTPVKIVSLKADHENPQVVVRKTWPGVVVVSCAPPGQPFLVTNMGDVTVPLFDGTGPTSQKLMIDGLHAVFQKPADIYLVYCESAAGVAKHGLVAVPKATVPVIELA